MCFRIFVNRVERAFDEVFERLMRGDALTQERIEFLPCVFDKIEEAGALVGKVKIEGAVAQPRLARDVLRPGRMVAALDEQPTPRLFELCEAIRFAPRGAEFNGNFKRRQRFHAEISSPQSINVK